MKKITLLLFAIFSVFQVNAQVSAYTFTESLGTYTEVSSGATLLAGVRTDTFLSTAQNIGFDFVYNGVTYTQFKMDSNGFISFNMTGTSSITTNNLSTANANARPIIAPLWDDLDGGDIASSVAGYEVTGTAPNRVLTVEWRNWQWNYTVTANPTISFQVKLYETTGVIEFVYRQEVANVGNGSASIGIGSATGSGAGSYLNLTSVATPSVSSTTAITNINTKPATGQIYRFTPPLPCTGTPTPGTVVPAELSRCTGDAVGALVASGYSTGVSGIVFQWQESPDGLAWGDAVGGTGATTATYTPPVYSGTPIQYRLRVTCTDSGLFDYTNPAIISSPANPSTQVTNATVVNPWLTAATVNWTNGNGTRRLVVVSDSPTIVDPTNGNDAALVANAVYSGSGQQIIFDGTAATATVTGLTQGTSYYVKVYEYLRCGAGPYDYYYNTSTGSNTATITTLVPPSNDLCDSATPLIVGVDFAANQLSGTLAGATTTAGITPSCQASFGLDVWYTVTVPASGNLTIETQVSPTNSMTDSVITVYSNACGTAQIVGGCDDDGGPDGPNTLMSKLTLTGRTPGEVLYVAVWKYQPAIPASTAREFLISAYDCPSLTPAPTGMASQIFCSYNNPTVANLVADGTAIKWYDAATAGNLLLSTDALVSGNIYYASQTLTCESFARLAVTATINNAPAEPTGDANQTFCSASSPTLASLAVTGTGLVWYDAATLGNVLPDTTVLTATTYYVASNDGTCESSRLAITTTEVCPIAGCFNAPFGQYPFGAAFTPANCDGLAQNVLATDCWAGEYSLINVTSGQTYIFGSSNASDFITISADAGVTAVASGTGSATWVSTLTGTVRFYTHLAACGTAQVSRTRYVTCGIPSLALPDYVSLQWPPTATIAQGGSVTVYGQVYEAGLTDVVPNIDGQAPGINAWVGFSTTNTNPNTWTNWVVATHNAGSIGNNDEYQATIGATLTPGTYYYATRFNLDGGNYVYGGINAALPNNGSFWDGTTFGNGVLTVTPPPAPANDDCSGAIALTVNSDYGCGTVTPGTVIGATASSTDATACGGTEDDDVWFSFVATSTAHRISLINVAGSTTDMFHSLWTGADCTSLALVPGSCSDPNVSNRTGLTIGQTYYVRVYTWTATAGQTSTFNICIGTPPPPPANDNFANATAVVCGNVYTGSTELATIDEDSAPDGFGADLDAPNVWYSFTGTGAAQTVTVSLCGSSYDTSVLVYTGTSGNLTLVAGNDDDATCLSNTANSSLSFASDGTTTYYITVEGWNVGSVGAFTMNVTCAAVTPPAVANQDCGTALAVLVDGSDNNSDNSFGTVSSTQPGCDLFGSIQDVWFSFVAPASGSVTALLTPGTMTSLNYNVYTGACGALTTVGNCNSNLTAANSQQYTTLTAGQTYYVQVWSNAAEQGTFTLRITDDGLGNESFDNSNFTYYPNPVKNVLNLSYSQDISSVEVYNLLGQKVSAISVNANQAQIDMSNLPSAAYIVKVTANNHVKTVRVIKE